jgi:uncharacterized protein YdhG (YjbR/CyaY superfamily)
MAKVNKVDEYIEAAPEHARKKLYEIRTLLKKAAPKATEAIKWNSPVLEEKRILFAFSAFKDHMTFMPTRQTLEPFKKELKGFKTGSDTVQFSYDEPLPVSLIRKLAEHRVKQVQEEDAKWMLTKNG